MPAQRCFSSLLIGLPLLTAPLVACAAPEPDPEIVESQGSAYSGHRGGAPAEVGIDKPAFAPDGFYPEANVGEYYGPCGPLSATWLMTWYVGRGPGGNGSNQACYDKVSSYAQGDRLFPGSSPSGLRYAINRVFQGSMHAGLGRDRTGASIEDIRGLVRSGRPVIVLIQWQEGNNNFPTMHYITVFGYRDTPEGFVYLVHDNGSFAEIGEGALDAARDTSFYNRGIVWIDRAVHVTLPSAE